MTTKKARRDVGEREAAVALGCTEKTLQRYRRRRPPVPHDKRDGRVLYNVDEVRAYQREHGLVDEDAAPPGDTTSAAGQDATTRALQRKAGAAVNVLKAEKAKLQLEAEKNLAALGLDRKIRESSTTEQLAEIAKEVAAFMAAGAVAPDRGRAILEALTEQRQHLKALAAERVKEEAFTRAFMTTPDGLELVRLYEGIVDDSKRASVLGFVKALAAQDQIERPAVDTGDPVARS